MSKLINQAGLKEGLQIIDEELAPSSEGIVSDKGMHIPDINLIDAKNALPTNAGYASFFGRIDKLEDTGNGLDADVQDAITYKTLYGDVIALAFCADGLYMKSMVGDAAVSVVNVPAAGDDPEYDKVDLVDRKAKWTQIWTTTAISPWKMWSYCLMENALYVFQKGMDYIGRVTAYQPEQIIFEHLEPTYILEERKRHKFTYTSEDDSTDDATWKSINITTDTGLDFGTQKILVDSAASVAMAQEAWEAVFANTGLFTTNFTETSRTETPIDAYIPCPDTPLEDISPLWNVNHNGTPTELTVEDFYGQNPGNKEEIDSYLVRISNLGALKASSGYTSIWTVVSSIGNFNIIDTGADAHTLAWALNNVDKEAYQEGKRIHACYITAHDPNVAANDVWRATDCDWIELTVEIARNGGNTAFDLTNDDGDIAQITITKTSHAGYRRYGGAVKSNWTLKFGVKDKEPNITTRRYGLALQYMADPFYRGNTTDLRDLFMEKFNSMRWPNTDTNIGNSTIAGQISNLTHISTTQIAADEYEYEFTFDSVDEAWGIPYAYHYAFDDFNILHTAYAWYMELVLSRNSVEYIDSANSYGIDNGADPYLAEEFLIRNIAGTVNPWAYHVSTPVPQATRIEQQLKFLWPTFNRTTLLTTAAMTWNVHAGASTYPYVIAINTDITGILANFWTWAKANVPGCKGVSGFRVTTPHIYITFFYDRALYDADGLKSTWTGEATQQNSVNVFGISDFGGTEEYEVYESPINIESIGASPYTKEYNLIVESIALGDTYPPTFGLFSELYSEAQHANLETLISQWESNLDTLNASLTNYEATFAADTGYNTSTDYLSADFTVEVYKKTRSVTKIKDLTPPDVWFHFEDTIGIWQWGLNNGGTAASSIATATPTLPNGVAISGFKKTFPTRVTANGLTSYFAPEDDSNTVATAIETGLNSAAAFDAISDTMVIVTPAACDLHYSFDVIFALVDTAAIPSSVEAQDGTTVFTEDSLASTILPMGHIDGIMSGRSRLGAWDEDNIIYWSSSTNLMDFAPSAETGANQVTVRSSIGNIIKCEGFTHGFVIYNTGNVVVATFKPSATSMYDFKPIKESEGIVDFRHLAIAKDIHYYWSSKGLTVLDPEARKIELADPILSDWVKKHRYPITLGLLSGRFLVIYLQVREPTFSNRAVRNGDTIPDGLIEHTDLTPVEFGFLYPGINLYPTYSRALILDLQLGKWGSCDGDLKQLISFTPYNQSGYQLSKNYELLDASLDSEQKELAIRGIDGFTYVANTFPTDSYVLFGHYATHRDRDTKLIGVETEFVNYPDAQLQIEKSEDGAIVDFTQNQTFNITALKSEQGLNMSARWFNILVKGHYHLKRLLTKGYTYGR